MHCFLCLLESKVQLKQTLQSRDSSAENTLIDDGGNNNTYSNISFSRVTVTRMTFVPIAAIDNEFTHLCIYYKFSY